MLESLERLQDEHAAAVESFAEALAGFLAELARLTWRPPVWRVPIGRTAAAVYVEPMLDVAARARRVAPPRPGT